MRLLVDGKPAYLELGFDKSMYITQTNKFHETVSQR